MPMVFQKRRFVVADIWTMKRDDWEKFEIALSKEGLTAEDVYRMIEYPSVIRSMLARMREQTVFNLVHGRFMTLAGKVAMVKRWPGIDPEDVDVALAAAIEDGTIAGYKREVEKNPLLDIVVTVYRATLAETVSYARERMRDAWENNRCMPEEYVPRSLADYDVKTIDGAKPFTPNRIVIEVVDFGANWGRKRSRVLEDVRKSQAPKLADFALLYNTVQSPEWVKQMNGVDVPYVVVAPLLIHVPFTQRSVSPLIFLSCRNARTHHGYDFEDVTRQVAIPVLRRYGKR